jgi:hypothetical protein
MQASWMRKLAVSKADIMAAIKERMEEGRMYEPMTQVCTQLFTSMDCVQGNPSKEQADCMWKGQQTARVRPVGMHVTDTLPWFW